MATNTRLPQRTFESIEGRGLYTSLLMKRARTVDIREHLAAIKADDKRASNIGIRIVAHRLWRNPSIKLMLYFN
jgi:hypothetical protein